MFNKKGVEIMFNKKFARITRRTKILNKILHLGCVLSWLVYAFFDIPFLGIASILFLLLYVLGEVTIDNIYLMDLQFEQLKMLNIIAKTNLEVIQLNRKLIKPIINSKYGKQVKKRK